MNINSARLRKHWNKHLRDSGISLHSGDPLFTPDDDLVRFYGFSVPPVFDQNPYSIVVKCYKITGSDRFTQEPVKLPNIFEYDNGIIPVSYVIEDPPVVIKSRW